MVLMSGGFVINDVVWELHETTLIHAYLMLAFPPVICYNREL